MAKVRKPQTDEEMVTISLDITDYVRGVLDDRGLEEDLRERVLERAATSLEPICCDDEIRALAEALVDDVVEGLELEDAEEAEEEAGD